MSSSRVASKAGLKRKSDGALEVTFDMLLRRADSGATAAALFGAAPTLRLDSRAARELAAARGAWLYVWSHNDAVEALSVDAADDASALAHALLAHLHRKNVMDVAMRPADARVARMRLYRMARYAAKPDDDESDRDSARPNTGVSEARACDAQSLLRATGAAPATPLQTQYAEFVARWFARVGRRAVLHQIGPSVPLQRRVRVVQ